MRFLVMVEVRGEHGGGWFRREIEGPCVSEEGHLLHVGVRLQRATSCKDDGGGVRVICRPLDGEHYANLLIENFFERCRPPIGYAPAGGR